MLTADQTRVMNAVLAEEAAKREHLVVSISGAHAYGFPSPDSDLDLKAIHAAPVKTLLGLGAAPSAAERLQIIDGVEIDYSSNELQGVLKGILQGNGNYLERVLGQLQPMVSPALASLRPLVKATLSRRLHRHYQGFGRSQWVEWQKGGGRSAKKLLYVLRTTLTGAHALATGEVETDLTKLMQGAGFSAAKALVDQKRAGEKSELPENLTAEWRLKVNGAFERLDEALARSQLPDVPTDAAVNDLEQWLIDFRLSK